LFESKKKIPDSAAEPSEQHICDLLEQRKWRKARDEAKLGAKKEPARFLTLIVRANIGLAQEMISKGLHSEARQVISYLKTIAPPETVLLLEAQMDAGSASTAGKATSLLAILNHASLPEADAVRHDAADRLVLLFDPQLDSDRPEHAATIREVQAIWSALQAVSEKSWEKAGETLRSVGARSPFRFWRLFIKGQIAFHRKDFATARRCFAELPPDTVPGRARRLYALWMDTEPAVRKAIAFEEPLIRAFGRMAGHSDMVPLLLGAEKKAGKERYPTDIRRHFPEGLPGFPSLRPDLIGALTDFYFHTLLLACQNPYSPYPDLLDDLVNSRDWENDTERMLFLQSWCFFFLERAYTAKWQSRWRDFLGLQEKFYGKSRRFRSMGYLWAAGLLIQPNSMAVSQMQLPSDRLPIETRHAKKAMELLQKSIQEDPGQRQAYVLLAKLLQILGRSKEYRTLFETMSERFPMDKEILTAAAGLCLERNEFQKGVAYLESALRIDRLDPLLADMYVRAQLMFIRQHYEKGNVQEARKIMDFLESSEYILDTQDNFDRSRWTLFLRRGLMEKGFVGEEAAFAWLQKASASAPSEAVCLLQSLLLWGLYRPKENPHLNPFDKPLRAFLTKRSDVGQALWLLRLYRYFSFFGNVPHRKRADDMIVLCLKAAGKQPFRREEFLQLVELLPPENPFTLCLRSYLQRLLQQDAKDPLARFFMIFYRFEKFQSPGERSEKLKEILEEAIARREDQAIRLIRRELEKEAKPKGYPPPPDLFDDDFDDDLDEMAENVPDYLMELLFDEVERIAKKERRRSGGRKPLPPPKARPEKPKSNTASEQRRLF